MRFVRELDYALLGETVHVTDAVDVSLVRPRPRKYETAGAASGAQETHASTPAAKPGVPEPQRRSESHWRSEAATAMRSARSS